MQQKIDYPEKTMALDIVRIHATTILLASPHYTALALFHTPTPIMAAVIVCVVLNGMPAMLTSNNVKAADVWAQKPLIGFSLVSPVPNVLMIFLDPNKVPNTMDV